MRKKGKAVDVPKPKTGKRRRGSVRKGFVMNRPHSKTSAVPGRTTDPDAARNVRLAGQKTRETARLLEAQQIKQCIWSTSKRGGLRKNESRVQCCKSMDCYREYRIEAGRDESELAGTILLYRRYYQSLDVGQRNDWWGQHSTFTGYEQKREGVVLKKHSRTRTYLCEPLDVMRSYLGWAESRDVFPCLDKLGAHPVCLRFLQFLVGGHCDTMYQIYVRQNAWGKEGGASPEDLDCTLPSIRKVRKSEEIPVMGPEVRNWLKDQGDMSLLDPTDDIKILPHRSIRATHAYYVWEMEINDGAAHAQSFNEFMDAGIPKNSERKFPDEDPIEGREPQGLHLFNVDNLGAIDEDADDEENADKQDALEAAILREEKANTKLYRYGNPRCGEKDPAARPELPGIAFYSTFSKLWRSDVELCKIVCREHLPFAKCNFCIRQRQKSDRRRTKKIIEDDNKELKDHLDMVRNEKQMYYSNRSRARRHPEAILSMIIDGADQSKYEQPHFKDASHLTAEMKKIKLHLYGCLVHGRGAYTFTMPDHERQGHNTTIQVIMHVLTDLLKSGRLPPVFTLQLDNTTKQNKGQYLYGFLALLVEKGVFEAIVVSFLPVGHTHEDIDQLFSRISMWLRHHNAAGRVSLAKAIKHAYKFEKTGEPAKVVHWDTIANVSEWLRPYTNNFAHGCMQYRHCRFFRSASDRKVWLQVTSAMDSWGDSTDEWRGLAEMTTHTEPWTTAYGVPDLWQAVQNGDMPPAAKRAPNPADIAKTMEGLKYLKEYSDDIFADEDFKDCEAMLDLHREPPKPFPWLPADVCALFGGEPDAGDNVEAQQRRGLPVGKIDELYICKPYEDDDDTFLLGRVMSATYGGPNHDESGVLMQWFQLATDGKQDDRTASRYKGKYKPVLPHSTRTDHYPWCSDACLQYKVKCQRTNSRAGGRLLSLRIYLYEVPNIKYYEARWANGVDLHDKPYERRLSSQFL